MSGRDHSETCETCGFQRGGLDDFRCRCESTEPAPASCCYSVTGLVPVEDLREAYRMLREGLDYAKWAVDVPRCEADASTWLDHVEHLLGTTGEQIGVPPLPPTPNVT